MSLDAPEARACCEVERERAADAVAWTRELVAAGVDYLMPRIGWTEDRYGRQLRHVVLRDGRDLTAVLIGEGLAVEYRGRGARQDWCVG